MRFLRSLFLLAGGVGGVMAALHLVKTAAARAGEDHFTINGEAALVVLPIAIAGGLVGILLAGIIFPRRS
jgi:hypothetical protein